MNQNNLDFYKNQLRKAQDELAALREIREQQDEQFFHTLDNVNEELQGKDDEIATCKDKLMMLQDAAQTLYSEVAEYIEINNLGYRHHNISMQRIQEAIAATAETVAKHRAEIEAKELDLAIARIEKQCGEEGYFSGVVVDYEYVLVILRSIAAEKRGE